VSSPSWSQIVSTPQHVSEQPKKPDAAVAAAPAVSVSDQFWKSEEGLKVKQHLDLIPVLQHEVNSLREQVEIVQAAVMNSDELDKKGDGLGLPMKPAAEQKWLDGSSFDLRSFEHFAETDLKQALKASLSEKQHDAKSVAVDKKDCKTPQVQLAALKPEVVISDLNMMKQETVSEVKADGTAVKPAITNPLFIRVPAKRPNTGCKCPKYEQKGGQHVHLLYECPTFQHKYPLRSYDKAMNKQIPHLVGSRKMSRYGYLGLHQILRMQIIEGRSEVDDVVLEKAKKIYEALPDLFDPECRECQALIGNGDGTSDKERGHCEVMLERFGVTCSKSCKWAQLKD
jgi:hypothetical protein